MDFGQHQESSETNNGHDSRMEWNNLKSNASCDTINESKQDVQTEREESNKVCAGMHGMTGCSIPKSIIEQVNNTNTLTNHETTKQVANEQFVAQDESLENRYNQKDYLLKALDLEAVKFGAVKTGRKRTENVHFTSPLAVIHEYSDGQNSLLDLDDTQSLSDSDLDNALCTLQKLNNNQTDQNQENNEEINVVEEAAEHKGNSDLEEQLDDNSKVVTKEIQTVRSSDASLNDIKGGLNAIYSHSELDLINEVPVDDIYDTLTPLMPQSTATKFTFSGSQPSKGYCKILSDHFVVTDSVTSSQTEAQLTVENISGNEESNTIQHHALSEAILNYSALPDELRMEVDENEFYVNNIPPEPQKMEGMVANTDKTSNSENIHISYSETDKLEVETAFELGGLTEGEERENQRSQICINRERDTVYKRSLEVYNDDRVVDITPFKQIKLDEVKYEQKEHVEVGSEDIAITKLIKVVKEKNDNYENLNLDTNINEGNSSNLNTSPNVIGLSDGYGLETATADLDTGLEQYHNTPEDMENGGDIVPDVTEASVDPIETDENNNLEQTDNPYADLVNGLPNEETTENEHHQQNVYMSDDIESSQTIKSKKTEEVGTDNSTHLLISQSSEKLSQIKPSPKEGRETYDIAKVEDEQILVEENGFVQAQFHDANTDIGESALKLENKSVMETNEDNQNADTNGSQNLKPDFAINEKVEMVDNFEFPVTETLNIECNSDVVTGEISNNNVSSDLKTFKYEFANEIDDDEDIVIYERQNSPEEKTNLNIEKVEDTYVEEKVTSINGLVLRDQLENRNTVVSVKEDFQSLLAHERNSKSSINKQYDASQSKGMHSNIEGAHLSGDKVEIVEHFDEKENLEKASSQIVPENTMEINNDTKIENLKEGKEDIDNTEGSEEQSLQEETIDDEHAVVPNNSALFIPASQVLSESSQESGSTGFIYDKSIAESLHSSQETAMDMFVSCVRKAREKRTMYELAGDGVIHEVVEDKLLEVAEIDNNTEGTMEVGSSSSKPCEREYPEEQEEQLDDGKLDDYIDQAVEDAVLDDHNVPCLPTHDPHLDDLPSIYAQDNEKKGNLYSCDADIYDDTDTPLCSLVDTTGRSVTPTGSCFCWKYTPSYDETSPVDLPNEDQVIQINPLKTCGKPLRLGLSRKQPVNRLHNLKNLKRP